MSAVLQPRVAADRRPNDPYASRTLTEATLVPRVDPVVHRPADRAGPLTSDQVSHFDENGYLVLENLFNAAEIDVLQAELTRLEQSQARLDPETLILEPDDRELRSVFRVHAQSGVMKRLASDSRLLDVARFLLADDVYVHQSRMNYKPGFFGKEFYWHSDFETWHVEDGMPRMRALSMSIALTENTEHNGPLMLIPGSHQTYVTCVGETPADHYKQSLRRQEYGVPDPASLTTLVDRGGIVAPKGPAGTVIVFECNMMHGSNSNITPHPRSNAFIVYNAISNALLEPFGGQRPRPEFIATRAHIEPLIEHRGRFA